MLVACKYCLEINAEKCDLKAESIMFFGCLYDSNGVHPNPAKVNAISGILAPTSVKTQEFLGITIYLGNFISWLLTFLYLYRNWPRKKVNLPGIPHQSMRLITSSLQSLVSQHYTICDASQLVTLSVETSWTGVNATIFKNDEQFSHESKTLTATEHRNMNTERVLLAVVFGCKHFCT